MKRLLLVMLSGIFAISAAAQDKLVFIVGQGVSTPVTVNCCGSSHIVYDNLEIDRPCSSVYVSATDCNGNRLKYAFKSRSGNDYSISFYTFSNADDYHYENGSSGSGGLDYEMAEKAGKALSRTVFSLGGGSEGEAYPSLGVLAGISYSYGEFIRMRYTGSGINLYAGIGKDFIFNSKFKNKILWHAGIGSYFAFGDYDPNMDVSVGLSLAQLAQYEKLSIMIDVDYTCWIGRKRRIGVFGGGSLGYGDFMRLFDTADYGSVGSFAYNFEAGIIIRIANF